MEAIQALEAQVAATQDQALEAQVAATQDQVELAQDQALEAQVAATQDQALEAQVAATQDQVELALEVVTITTMDMITMMVPPLLRRFQQALQV